MIRLRTRIDFSLSLLFFSYWANHGAFKSLLREQIRQKLIAFEGQAKPSKIKSAMKWWWKCISMVIAKTASRSVAFKAAKIAESALAGQSEILTREPAKVDALTDEEPVDDLGRNADLYIFNQDDSDSQQVDDVRSGRQPHSQQGTDVYNFQSRLD